MDEKLQQLVDVLLIERGYAYEKRSIKYQRQGEIFKKTAEYLTLCRKCMPNAGKSLRNI